MSDILLLANTMLGFFAGIANGYLSLRIKRIPLRAISIIIALICVGVGAAYGGTMLNYIPLSTLGPTYLRPLLTLILLALAALPFTNQRDDLHKMEMDVAELKRQINEQSAEIYRLNEVIKALVRQMSNPTPTTPYVDVSAGPLSPKPPKILVAAVEASELDVRGEVDGIFDSGIRYEYLAPPVSRNRMISELDRLHPAGVHLLGHMSAMGMELADGTATVGWWRRLFERYSVQFVFANGCESLDIVDALRADGVACVVGVRGEVKDDAAVEFARQFYYWLAAGRMASEAVELSRLSLGHVDAEQVVIRGEWSYR